MKKNIKKSKQIKKYYHVGERVVLLGAKQWHFPGKTQVWKTDLRIGSHSKHQRRVQPLDSPKADTEDGRERF